MGHRSCGTDRPARSLPVALQQSRLATDTCSSKATVEDDTMTATHERRPRLLAALHTNPDLAAQAVLPVRPAAVGLLPLAVVLTYWDQLAATSALPTPPSRPPRWVRLAHGVLQALSLLGTLEQHWSQAHRRPRHTSRWSWRSFSA